MSKSVYVTAVTTNPEKTVTPQSQPLRGREAEMAANNAGGVVFTLSIWDYLDRFLILGSATPTYYASANKLTINAIDKAVLPCIKEDAKRTVDRIVELSLDGRAVKNDPALAALALCTIHAPSDELRAYAWAALPKVARIGTHLFQFVSIINEAGKWNAAAKRGIANWYGSRSVDKLAVQLLKYQQRDGWSHRDVLRLAHVKPSSPDQSNLFKYVTAGEMTEDVNNLVKVFEALKVNQDKKFVLESLEAFPQLSWEMLPTQWQRDADVMSALIPNMGVTALIRKLGQLTNIGVIGSLTAGTKLVVSKLNDAEALKAGRVHPITLLNAFNQYSKGRGDKGSLVWTPSQSIVSALNDAFYEAFNFIEPTGKNHLVAIDCSGSMFCFPAAGMSNLTAAEVASVMAMAVIKREPNYWVCGFNTRLGELKITPSMRLDSVMNVVRHFSWGGTDCSLPARHAAAHNMQVDKFVQFTDNETWAGPMHVPEALAKYRKKSGIAAAQIVCATSTTGFSIADPKDPLQLDIVGFDSNCPQLIQSFGN